MSTEPRRDGSAICKQIQVKNRLGLHARPANLIARAAMTFTSRVEIKKGNETVDATSIISLLTLGAEQGTQLEIHADGDDSEAAVRTICELFDRGFDEDEEFSS